MEQKYYEGKRKGTEVQRGLFQSSPTLTFVDEGVEIDGNVFETSDIDGLIRCLHDNASEKLLGAEMGTLKAVQRVMLNGLFMYFSKVIKDVPADENLIENTHEFFRSLDMFVRLTAAGASDEGYLDLVDFLEESLKTEDLTKTIALLLETYDKMRGKKITKERQDIYDYLDKSDREATKNHIPFSLKFELDNYCVEKNMKFGEEEKEKIIQAFYQWRNRRVRKEKSNKINLG